STTFVRPVMPISIDDFAGTGGAAANQVHLEVFGWTGNRREEAATGVVFSVIGLTSTIAAFALAPLGERIGYKNVVAGAALVTGLLYPTVALADNLLAFMVLLGAVGIFQGSMVPGTNALIAASA